MTSDALLIVFLPFLVVMAAATVWLRLSARRIDRMLAEAEAEKARQASQTVVTVPPLDPEMMAKWQAGITQMMAEMRVTPSQIITEAKTLAEAAPRPTRRKAAAGAKSKAAAGRTG